MTVTKLYKLYSHYKDLYDFQLTKKSYRELADEQIKQEEWLPF